MHQFIWWKQRAFLVGENASNYDNEELDTVKESRELSMVETCSFRLITNLISWLK